MKTKIFTGIIIILLAFCRSSFPADDSPDLVRVAVVVNADKLKLSLRCPYRILALKSSEVLHTGSWLWTAEVIPTEAGIKIGRREFQTNGIRFQPQKDALIHLNGRKFRGVIDIVLRPNKKLQVINRLGVEEYLQGVLYHEAVRGSPIEALKAQAITARTYALYQAKENSAKDYDLTAGAYSQVYGGRSSEKRRATKAVKLTKNKALTCKDKIFPAFYHSTCAGHTENAACLWKIKLPPLEGRECRFCRKSPHTHWTKRMSLLEIEEALREAGINTGTIKTLEVADRDISGRVSEIKITCAAGEVKIDGNRFRLALGPNQIKSANFDWQIKKDKVYFQGKGWGHGVGMCQWGAFFMSRSGFTAEQILGYYYPESKIKDVQEIRDARGKPAAY